MNEEDSETEWDRAIQQAKQQAARHRHHRDGTGNHPRGTTPGVTPEQYQADKARFSQLLNIHLEPLTYHQPTAATEQQLFQSHPKLTASKQLHLTTTPTTAT